LRTISCNKIKLPITENLFQALRALRLPNEHRYLWVDAISINQSDTKEVSEQVSHMLQIYQKAASVIAWLGGGAEEDLDTIKTANSVLEQRIYRNSFWESHDLPKPVVDFQKLRQTIENIYTQPWFTRTWIQQEVFAARNLIFQYGDTQFSWYRPVQGSTWFEDTRSRPQQAAKKI
jgi:hypothetical protein